MTGRVTSDPRSDATDVERLLQQAPSFQQLDPGTRRAVAESMAKVVHYLAAPDNGGRRAPLAGQLAPDLRAQLSPGNSGSTVNQGGGGMFTDAPPSSQPVSGPVSGPTNAPVPAGGGGAVGRVGEVARATLSAIDFPQFVSALIQGTFQAIVDASIQQMEAYAKLLQAAATTIDRFMDEQISDGQARDYLAEQNSGFFMRDTAGAAPVLRVRPDRRDGELPAFLKDLGFDSPQEIDEGAIEQVVVPATRRRIAEERQQTLATMVLMGINRVVVDDGEITAKLVFHIDATDQTHLKFDQSKTTAGTMAGRAGTNPFSAQALMVNTINLNTQSDVNVRADLTGQVKVKFRNETFPLDRFADSAAIQLINTRAKVPERAGTNGDAAVPSGAVSTPPTPPQTPITPPQPLPKQPTIPPIAPPPPTQPVSAPTVANPGGLSLAASRDPWA